ncbi:hypothetical protein BpHYR1_026328 [Brachionus plicatilis]|uniref:Uncharacterized protein n=1 Tax=Brachionus plicatilis TaxID=10195 RepID=A0A3M7QR83_BRAPC|nr:hypothetical protein BpHYR1_026328 [Brachionus plicatilis]
MNSSNSFGTQGLEPLPHAGLFLQMVQTKKKFYQRHIKLNILFSILGKEIYKFNSKSWGKKFSTPVDTFREISLNFWLRIMNYSSLGLLASHGLFNEFTIFYQIRERIVTKLFKLNNKI